jgi:hypothetical protein
VEEKMWYEERMEKGAREKRTYPSSASSIKNPQLKNSIKGLNKGTQ